MKVTIDLPETTMCVFANYLFIDDNGNTSMGVKSLCTEDLHEFREYHVVEGKKKEVGKYVYQD